MNKNGTPRKSQGYRSYFSGFRNKSYPNSLLGFPNGSDVQNLPANAGDSVSISGLGRSPREGNGNPLHFLDRGTWWATVYGVAKRLTQLSNLTITTTNSLLYNHTEMEQDPMVFPTKPPPPPCLLAFCLRKTLVKDKFNQISEKCRIKTEKEDQIIIR